MAKFPLKYIFYFESVVNVATITLCLFFPNFFLVNLMGSTIDITQISLDVVRWYGVLLVVITYILVRFLIKESLTGFLVVLEAYLVGDFLQIVVSLLIIKHTLNWNFGILFTIGITVFLIIYRIIVLKNPKILGFSNNGNE